MPLRLKPQQPDAQPVRAPHLPPALSLEPEPEPEVRIRLRFGFGDRVKCLFWASFWLLWVYCLVNFSFHLPTLVRLSVAKKQVTAMILDSVATDTVKIYSGRKTGPTTHRYQVEIEGQKVWVDLGASRLMGPTVSVIYVPGDPQTAMAGRGDETFSQLVRDNIGWPPLIAGLVFMLFFALLGLDQLAGVVLGRRLIDWAALNSIGR